MKLELFIIRIPSSTKGFDLMRVRLAGVVASGGDANMTVGFGETGASGARGTK